MRDRNLPYHRAIIHRPNTSRSPQQSTWCQRKRNDAYLVPLARGDQSRPIPERKGHGGGGGGKEHGRNKSEGLPGVHPRVVRLTSTSTTWFDLFRCTNACTRGNSDGVPGDGSTSVEDEGAGGPLNITSVTCNMRDPTTASEGPRDYPMRLNRTTSIPLTIMVNKPYASLF